MTPDTVAPTNDSQVGLATVVTLKLLPSPLYDRTVFDESNTLPDGAPRNVEIGT